MSPYESRVQMQPFKFEVGQQVVFAFNNNAHVGVIWERFFDHDGENLYKIRVSDGLSRTVLERNIQDPHRHPRSLAPGPFNAEVLPPPPPGEIHVRSDDVIPPGWA